MYLLIYIYIYIHTYIYIYIYLYLLRHLLAYLLIYLLIHILQLNDQYVRIRDGVEQPRLCAATEIVRQSRAASRHRVSECDQACARSRLCGAAQAA